MEKMSPTSGKASQENYYYCIPAIFLSARLLRRVMSQKCIELGSKFKNIYYFANCILSSCCLEWDSRSASASEHSGLLSACILGFHVLCGLI